MEVVSEWGWLCVWVWLELGAVDRGGQCGCGASSWMGRRSNMEMGLGQTENTLVGRGVQVGVRAGWRL